MLSVRRVAEQNGRADGQAGQFVGQRGPRRPAEQCQPGLPAVWPAAASSESRLIRWVADWCASAADATLNKATHFEVRNGQVLKPAMATSNSTLRSAALLQRGLVIPACPLALNPTGGWTSGGSGLLLRYYAAAGAGGMAVGVHTTQFAIRDPKIGLFEPV